MQERRLHTDSNEVVSHLKELTTALTAVHEDLYWLAMQPPNANDKPAVPAAELNVDMLSELKSAVDDMRLLLWQYIETASEVNPQHVQERMDSQRLHRVTKFLQLLRKRLALLYPNRHVLEVEAGADTYKTTLILNAHAN